MHSALVTNAPFGVTNTQKTVIKLIITVFEMLSKPLFTTPSHPYPFKKLGISPLVLDDSQPYKNWAGAS